MSQEAHVESLTKRFDVQSISGIPASPGADLGPKQDDESGGDWPVREAVGSLVWLSTMTRPDITNAVRAVARYAHELSERLWQVIMKILLYLNGTKSLDITYYVRGSGLSLKVYADADYANKDNDRRSVSGIAKTLGGTHTWAFCYLWAACGHLAVESVRISVWWSDFSILQGLCKEIQPDNLPAKYLE